MRLQAVDATQVNFTPRDHLEHQGEAPGSPRGADAFAGGRLRHMMARHAEIEHRRMAVFRPELAVIDGIDVPQQGRRVVMIFLNQVAELGEQRLIR